MFQRSLNSTGDITDSVLLLVALLCFPILYLSLELGVWHQHVLRQMLSAERIIWRGENVSLDILPLTYVARRQPHWIWHELPHNGALELWRVVFPLLLLSQLLDHDLVCSVPQGLESRREQLAGESKDSSSHLSTSMLVLPSAFSILTAVSRNVSSLKDRWKV